MEGSIERKRNKNYSSLNTTLKWIEEIVTIFREFYYGIIEITRHVALLGKKPKRIWGKWTPQTETKKKNEIIKQNFHTQLAIKSNDSKISLRVDKT